jgi:hypothetical protein
LSALVALGLGSGCADDGQSAGSTTSTTTDVATTSAQATTTTVVDDEREVLDSYVAFWNEGYLVAADPMDPTHPALAEHATGEQLETLQRAFLALQTSGEVIRGTLDLAPRLVSVDGQSATVRDCYLDNTGVYDAATGERRDTPTGVRHLITATLTRDGDTWKVSDLEQEGDGCTAA